VKKTGTGKGMELMKRLDVKLHKILYKKIKYRNLISGILCMVLIITALLGTSCVKLKQVKEKELVLSGPRIVPDSSMEAGQKVTWDCIWFGSYPQAEVVPANEEYTELRENLLQPGDLTRDDLLYQTLQSATGWDNQGDIVIGNSKYRRIKKKDAIYTSSSLGCYYHWKNKKDYHYFKYQPVKWRVLSVNGSEIFLLADKILDNRQYHIKDEDVTWEDSTIRSWLNGYSASAGMQEGDSNSKNFIDTAFGISEQQVIKETIVENKDNINYGTDGGNDTYDKIFLLSESEVYTGAAHEYGFFASSEKEDEARVAKSSVYAKAMGVLYEPGIYNYKDRTAGSVGNCWWWLRSPGYYGNYAVYANCYGRADGFGIYTGYKDCGVRPALKLETGLPSDTLSSKLWSYAGTVCSDGKAEEEGGELQTGSYDILKDTRNLILSSPRIVPDSILEDWATITWDFVWFGSYPQAEVVPDNKKYTSLPEEFLENDDLVKDDELYQTLQNATGWDKHGDIVIDGNKYKRMKKKDATYISKSYYYYSWKNNTDYHYFKYQPVKWKVLSVNGSEVFLLSDKVLDGKQYHVKHEDVTWEGSTIRSWLNGYDASGNIQDKDYSKENFIDTAFGVHEQLLIKESFVENKGNIDYGADGGNDTYDKIFLLSKSETYDDEAKKYGFKIGSGRKYYEHLMTYYAKPSIYAKAQGIDIDNWCLRSPGHYNGSVMWVEDDLGIFYVSVDEKDCAIRPALKLDLAASLDTEFSGLWSYAGTEEMEVPTGY